MKAVTTPHEPVARAKAAWIAPITENERAWIEFLRLTSDDTDPAPTLERVQKLRNIFLGCRAGSPHPETRNQPRQTLRD